MELDENGRARGTGRFEKLEADTVILAIGQESDTRFLHDIPGMTFNGDVVNVRNQADDPSIYKFEKCKEGIPVGVVEGGTAAGKIVVTKAGGFGPVHALSDTITELTTTLAHSTEASS